MSNVVTLSRLELMTSHMSIQHFTKKPKSPDSGSGAIHWVPLTTSSLMHEKVLVVAGYSL